MTRVRNFGIVLLLAAAVYAIPGGDTAAALVQALLFIAVTVGIALLVGRMYLDNRSDLFALGDGWRLVLYGATGLLVLLLAGTDRLFASGPGTLLWIVLMGAVVYAFYAVFRRSREY